MTAPTFNLTNKQIWDNAGVLNAYRLDQASVETKKIYGIGVTAWGHTFFVVENRGRMFDIYHIFFKLFVKMGLIETIGSKHFVELEKYTDRKFTALISNQLTTTIANQGNILRALESENVTVKEEVASLRAENAVLRRGNIDPQPLEQQINAQQATIEDLKGQLSNIKIALGNAQDACEELKASKSDVVIKLNDSISIKEFEIKNLKAQLDESKIALAEADHKHSELLGTKTKELEKELAYANSERQKLINEKHLLITEHNAKYLTLENQIQDLKNQHSETIIAHEKAIKDKENQFTTITAAYNGLNKELDVYKQQQLKLEADVFNLKNAAAQKDATLKNKLNELENLAKKVQDLNTLLTEAQTQNAMYHKNLNAALAERDHHQKEVATFAARFQELDNNIHSLEDNNEALTSENEELKGKLKQAQSEREDESLSASIARKERDVFDNKFIELKSEVEKIKRGIQSASDRIKASIALRPNSHDDLKAIHDSLLDLYKNSSNSPKSKEKTKS